MKNENYNKQDERPVLSLRVSGELKQSLIDEAKVLNVTLSEFVECQILNFDKKNEELILLQHEFNELDDSFQALMVKCNSWINYAKKLEKENEKLKEQVSIYSDPYFKKLYASALKHSVTYDDIDGEVQQITINDPVTFLRFIVHCYRFKQK